MYIRLLAIATSVCGVNYRKRYSTAHNGTRTLTGLIMGDNNMRCLLIGQCIWCWRGLCWEYREVSKWISYFILKINRSQRLGLVEEIVFQPSSTDRWRAQMKRKSVPDSWSSNMEASDKHVTAMGRTEVCSTEGVDCCGADVFEVGWTDTTDAVKYGSRNLELNPLGHRQLVEVEDFTQHWWDMVTPAEAEAAKVCDHYGRPLSVPWAKSIIFCQCFLFIFYGHLILQPWLTEVRESFTHGGPWV